MSEASLSELPAEILNIVAINLNNRGLQSMRGTCRKLCAGSAFEFHQRFTSSEVEILSTRYPIHSHHDIKRLTVLLASPNLAKAQITMAHVVDLHNAVKANKAGDLENAGLNASGKDKQLRIIATDPSDFTFVQKKVYTQQAGSKLVPLILERIAVLPPLETNLRRLVIEGAEVDGGALIEIFEAHKHQLRRLNLRKVTFKRFMDCVKAMRSSEIRHLEMHDLAIIDNLGGYGFFSSRHSLHSEVIEIIASEWRFLKKGFHTFVCKRKNIVD